MTTTASGQPAGAPASSRVRHDFGDYQTPPVLAAEVLAVVATGRGRFERVLEPTCGRGHFLAAVLDGPDPPREVRGVEIQPDLADLARGVVGDRGRILAADLFRVDPARDLGWSGLGRLLVVGNPPWVTVAALGASGGSARNPGPERSNARGSRGLDALTGASNFDLAEAVTLKLVRDLAGERPTIALLVKATVARAILRAIATADLPIRRAEFRRIDSARWFGAAVAAGLFVVEVGPGPRATEAAVFPTLDAATAEATWAIRPDGSLVADRAAYERSRLADGASPLRWRQGVKHDAAAVAELTPLGPGAWCNGLGEPVDVELDRIYPWFKATDLARGATIEPRRAVVIPQRTLGEDPGDLARTHPRLWAYLARHGERFDRRRSSIYRNRPRFALFGIGPYTFSPFKVAISGLHKELRFRVLGTVGGRPPLVDDTCYFLPVVDADAACLVAALLNGPMARDLLDALCFRDGKRPITGAVLGRIDLDALLAHADPDRLLERVEHERAALAPDDRRSAAVVPDGPIVRFAWPAP